MARTKASVGAKVMSGKSSKARCSAAPPASSAPSTSSGDKSRNYSGGNPVCQRETPKWQRPITNFFITDNTQSEDKVKDNDGSGCEAGSDCEAGTSDTKPKQRRNIIHSDSEDETTDKLNETIELEPLNGEQSHKIDEYYTSKDKGKGKGKGKKSNKENIYNCNGKRGYEDEVNEPVSKKIKVE